MPPRHPPKLCDPPKLGAHWKLSENHRGTSKLPSKFTNLSHLQALCCSGLACSIPWRCPRCAHWTELHGSWDTLQHQGEPPREGIEKKRLTKRHYVGRLEELLKLVILIDRQLKACTMLQSLIWWISRLGLVFCFNNRRLIRSLKSFIHSAGFNRSQLIGSQVFAPSP